MEYEKFVTQAKEFWGQVAFENGWSMNDRGCTIWVNKNNEMLDNVYNEETNKNSYIIQVELDWEGFYENEKLIKTIK